MSRVEENKSQILQGKERKESTNLKISKLNLDKNKSKVKTQEQTKQDEIANKLISILNSQGEKKGAGFQHREGKTITKLIKDVKFFKERNLGNSDLLQVAQSLQYEYFAEGETVFEHSSFGDKFYIIIKGKVRIMVPTDKEEDNVSGTPTSILQRPSSRYQFKKENKASTRPQSKEISKCREGVGTPKVGTGLIENTYKERLNTPNNNLQAKVDFNSAMNSARKHHMPGSSAIDIEIPSKHTSRAQSKVELATPLHASKIKLKSAFDTPRSFLSPKLSLLQVATRKDGESFGELALITSKARAATIITKSECHFAVIKRRDYEKILKQIDIKKLNEVTNFLLSLPCFSMCTKRSMHKIKFYFQKQEYTKSQIVFHEGLEPKYVYIVKSGLFEMKVKVVKVEKKNLPLKNYLGPREFEESSEARVVGSKKTQLNSDTIKNVDYMEVCILGEGQMFGEEDVILQRISLTTVTCIDFVGELYAIPAQEFYRRIKPLSEPWKFIMNGVFDKTKKLQQKLILFNKNKNIKYITAISRAQSRKRGRRMMTKISKSDIYASRQSVSPKSKIKLSSANTKNDQNLSKSPENVNKETKPQFITKINLKAPVDISSVFPSTDISSGTHSAAPLQNTSNPRISHFRENSSHKYYDSSTLPGSPNSKNIQNYGHRRSIQEKVGYRKSLGRQLPRGYRQHNCLLRQLLKPPTPIKMPSIEDRHSCIRLKSSSEILPIANNNNNNNNNNMGEGKSGALMNSRYRVPYTNNLRANNINTKNKSMSLLPIENKEILSQHKKDSTMRGGLPQQHLEYRSSWGGKLNSRYSHLVKRGINESRDNLRYSAVDIQAADPLVLYLHQAHTLNSSAYLPN